jgi:hypothetical protein
MFGHNDQNTRQSLEIAGGLYPVGSYGAVMTIRLKSSFVAEVITLGSRGV